MNLAEAVFSGAGQEKPRAKLLSWPELNAWQRSVDAQRAGLLRRLEAKPRAATQRLFTARAARAIRVIGDESYRLAAALAARHGADGSS